MINRVILCGRLTKDVEIRKTTSGKTVIAYTLAVERDKEHTDFINCVAWNKLAELMSQYTHKGDMVAIEGKLNTRSYDNQQGQKVYVTEVIAENAQFLTPRNDFNEQNTLGVTNTYGAQNYAQNQSYGAQTRNHNQSNVQYAQSLTQQAEVDALEIASDDLPF